MYFRNIVSLCIDRFLELADTGRREVCQALNLELGCSIQSPDEFVRWIKPLKYSDQQTIERVRCLLDIDLSGYLTGRQPYLTSDQVRVMQSEGFAFGSHTRNHPNLADLPQPEALAEITGSCRDVMAVTGDLGVPFAFPFSAHRVDRYFLAQIMRRNPFIDVMFDTKGVQKDHPFLLSRISTDRRPGTGEGPTNLPDLMQEAYYYNWRVFLHRFGLSTL